MTFSKLVRDKIPELIEQSGAKANIRILDSEEYTRQLERKLDEEVAEYHDGKNLEELADILEVVYALAENLGHTRRELLDVHRRKREERGGFEKGIFLISKE